ncbi:hypothetical protein MXB_773, partial [Myxobolus squamalis]
FKLLIEEAKKIGIDVKIMPKTMTRHTLNMSRYDKKQDIIYWTLELRFRDSIMANDIVKIINKISGTTALYDIVKQFFDDYTLNSNPPISLFPDSISVLHQSSGIKYYLNSFIADIMLTILTEQLTNVLECHNKSAK